MSLRILHSADWHINLSKKKVPSAWQINRYKKLFARLEELYNECDLHIISGDIFDREPNSEEICLFNGFLNKVSIPTYIIPGNHEATTKGKTFMQSYLKHEAISNSYVNIIVENTRIEINGFGIQFFPYTCVQLNKLPKYTDGDILVSHIRGEIPPHIGPEFDFDRLKPWKLILLGDLHFNHKYKDTNAFYCGSPVNTTFDRDQTKDYGVNIYDVKSDINYDVSFIKLHLPKLLRVRIETDNESDLVKDKYDHIIYEVVNSIDKLANIKNNELLDKKIAYKEKENSVLDLSQASSILEELELYLEKNKIANITEILNEFKELNII